MSSIPHNPRRQRRVAVATICLATAAWAGAVGGNASADTQYSGVITIAPAYPVTLAFPATLPAQIDFGMTFDHISSLCVTAQFEGDLFDTGEGFELFYGGGGVGRGNAGAESLSAVTVCTGPTSTELNQLFLDGHEEVEFETIPDFPDYTQSSLRIVSLSAVLFGVASDADCTITGTAGPDKLYGTSANDVICGLGGDDVIWGYSGSDTILGGNGKDTIHGGPGRDVVDGGPQGDKILGGPDNDVLVGGPGWDDVFGGDGNDTIRTGDDPDLASGGTGNDWIELGAGDKQVAYGGSGDDVLLGGEMADRLYGGDGNDSLVGFGGHDQLYGGDGNDSLSGHAAPDWLCGQGGDDDDYTDVTPQDRVCPYDRADI